MSRPVLLRLFRSLPLLAALVLALAGCGDGDRMNRSAETDEPSYREGESLLKTGRKQEALNAFLRVIEKRGDDAPESHLEVGLLYLQHINDPLSAIYHFKQYLAARPNSPQAPLVRQRIDAATREFAQTLPAQPLETQLQRVDLVAALDRLKQENEALKEQLADLKSVRGLPAAAGPTAAGTAPAASDGNLNFSVESIPTVRTHPPAPVPVRSATPAPARAAATKGGAGKAAPATTVEKPAAGRRHTVQHGDTLSKLAQQYYGNRARWREIFAANRDVMQNESDLKVGTQLKIP